MCSEVEKRSSRRRVGSSSSRSSVHATATGSANRVQGPRPSLPSWGGEHRPGRARPRSRLHRRRAAGRGRACRVGHAATTTRGPGRASARSCRRSRSSSRTAATPTPTPEPGRARRSRARPPAPVVEPPPPPPPPPPVFDPVTGHTVRPARAATDVREPGVVDQRLDRRLVGLRAAQLHELRRLAAAGAQPDGRLLQQLRRRALGQRGELGRRRPPARLPRRRRAGHRRRRAVRRRPRRPRRLGERHRPGHGDDRGVQPRDVPGGYGTRTVPVGDFRYLHLDDVAPSPLLGSDRPIVSVPDGLGESWTARVDGAGTLWLSRPGGPTRAVGPRRAFSTLAAPALDARRARACRGSPPPPATAASWPARRATAGWCCAGWRPPRPPPARRSPCRAPDGRCSPRTSPAGTLQSGASPGTPAGAARSGSAGRARGRRTSRPVLGPDGAGRTLLVAVGRARRDVRHCRSRRAASPGSRGAGLGHLDAGADRDRRRHDVPPPGRRRRPAPRPHPRRSAVEPARGDRRRLVALRLPRRRHAGAAGCTSPPSTAAGRARARSAAGRARADAGPRPGLRATPPARPGW